MKSDADLLKFSGTTLEAIHQRAQNVLQQLNAENSTQPTSEAGQKRESSNSKNLISRLFVAYEGTDDVLSQCAISYLIKNGGKVSETKEDPEKFAHRIHRKQKEIERLEEQISARLPKGRDLKGEEFLETLAIATQQIPETVAQMREWQDKILTRPISLPYPIMYGSSTDVRWGQTKNGRITISFNGIDKYLKAVDPEIKEWFKVHKEHPFRLHCDQRQLPFFQRFLKDWQDYQANQETYPAGLLTLSSSLLTWQEGEGKGEPWNVNHLALHCSFDTRLMSAEGTLEVQQEKSNKATKRLNHAKPDPRNHSTLARLNNVPERPSKPPYQGNPEILVGLSIGLANPITAAVVNGRTGEVLTYRTPKTLLGDRYRLFNRHRQQRQQNSLQRYKNQKRGVSHQPSESELGEYVDRLLAKSIIQLVQSYQAGSIVIPNLKSLRELLNSEILARAEQKCPGSVKVQAQYAKSYRRTINQWSYNRLIEAIQHKAEQLGITVELGFQAIQGDSKVQARDLAIAAYQARASSMIKIV